MSMTLNRARQLAHDSGDGTALVTLVPYAAYLGVQLRVHPAADTGSSEVQAHFLLPFRDDLVGNPSPPAFHGGVIAGFMENAALLHILLLTGEQQRIPKSIDFSIDYLHSAQTHDLLAQCTVERIGRRVAQVQIRCTHASADTVGRCVAVARAHFLLSDVE